MTALISTIVFVIWIGAVLTVCYYVKKYDLLKNGQHRKYSNHAVYDDTYSKAVKETARFYHDERPEFILTDKK